MCKKLFCSIAFSFKSQISLYYFFYFWPQNMKVEKSSKAVSGLSLKNQNSFLTAFTFSRLLFLTAPPPLQKRCSKHFFNQDSSCAWHSAAVPDEAVTRHSFSYLCCVQQRWGTAGAQLLWDRLSRVLSSVQSSFLGRRPAGTTPLTLLHKNP